MENGKQKLISDIKVGDSVLAVDERGVMQFSQVIMDLHQSSEEITNFLVIRTETGRSLTLSPLHLIYKTDNDNLDFNFKELSKPVFAYKVKKGDFFFVFDENNGMKKDEIVSIDVKT